MHKEMLDVLMFGWELPPYNTGGLGVACYGLARGLSQQGVNIAFALPRRLQQHVPFMNILSHRLQGVSVTAINSLLAEYATAQSYSFIEPQRYREHVATYGLSLYDEAQRFSQMATVWSQTQSHQLIHSHDWMTYPAGMSAAKVSGNPLVVHVHATEFDRTGGYVDSRIAEIEYQGMQKADKIIAVSNYTKNVIIDHYAVSPEKITVVHNGVDPVDFTPQDIRRVFPHDNIVLFVGRLTFQKGVDYFLRMSKKVLSDLPNTVFLVVGDGDMYQQLIMQAASMGIANRVIFTGFLKGAKLKSVYQMADVFVMPSVSEPYGIVALEAIASGTPTVISKQSGVSENLKSVYKVDFWDVDQMASTVSHILTYPSLANEQALKAKREVKALTWEKAAQKTVAVYSSLLS